LVPGGTFYRSYDGVDYTDKSYPATVSDFYLDKYEITVGRFRVFVNAGMGTQASPPAASAGAHLGITGSGWDSTWNTNLAADTASLTDTMKCNGYYGSYQPWTDTAGSNESMPVTCLDWYTAFAFCAWDGGRLATEAEWNYAASGGSEQRYYPWSSPATSTTVDDSYAVYCGGSCGGTQNVGSKSPKGDGKWGQSDLAGNVWEWTLDWYASPYSMPCNNCADLTAASNRGLRGGGFDYYIGGSAGSLQSAYRSYYGPGNYRLPDVGARCARTSL
jgi:formylglycine-generating enzyme required for sulfatase activity